MKIFMRALPVLLLAAVCIAGVAAVFPVIRSNTDDPNLIAYFNNDESYFMDEAWYYYSGEKRASFQYENDCGVEFLYLTGFCKLALSKLVKFTPVTFVLILRWLNIIFWVGSIIAVWALVRRHFGYRWEALFIAALLATRPALPHLAETSKPEFMVLFFMIVGLDYTLRIPHEGVKKNLYLSIICASIASLIKIAGIFLLPAIVVALFLSQRDKKKQAGLSSVMTKAAWLFPFLVGLIFILIPIAVILFYVRQSTGLTWCKQFGFWHCIFRVKLIFYFVFFGISLAIFSVILRIFNNSKINILKQTVRSINKIFSFTLPVFVLFALFTMVLGVVWLINPGHFIQSVATMAVEAFSRTEDGFAQNSGLLFESGKQLMYKIRGFGKIFFVLFILSLFAEVYRIRRNQKQDRTGLYKRIILISFVLSIMVCLSLRVRLEHHHMLPFFTASAILVMQEIKIFYKALCKKRSLKFAAICVISAIFTIDIFQNADASAISFDYLYHRKEDVVFKIVRWWRENYPPDTEIVADHPTRVYIPYEYINAKFIKFVRDPIEQLQTMAPGLRQGLVYYRIDETNGMRPLEKMLTGADIRLVASFDNSSMPYQRFPKSKFVIYRVKY